MLLVWLLSLIKLYLYYSNGDSGGPLMKFKKFPNANIAYYMIVGLVSFGPSKCGTKDAPGIIIKTGHSLITLHKKMKF